MTPTPPRRFRVTCPLCGELTGVPWSVVTAGGGTVTINLRCECGHHWCATRAAEESAPYEGRRGMTREQSDYVIELRRKADRRSAH